MDSLAAVGFDEAITFRQFVFAARDEFLNGVAVRALFQSNKQGLAWTANQTPAQAQAIRRGRGLPEFGRAGNGSGRVEAYAGEQRAALQAEGADGAHPPQQAAEQTGYAGRSVLFVPYGSPGVSRGKTR